MVRLQRLTGALPGEVCGLKPAYIDRSGNVWMAILTEHKTKHHGKTRTIYIGPKAQSVLLPYLLRDENDFCFKPSDSERKRRTTQSANRVTPMSCGNRPGTNVKAAPAMQPGDQYDVSAFRRAIHRACVKANVQCWHPNQLRHSAATEIRKQFGLDSAASILGHSDVGVTQVYAENDRTKALAVALKIG